MLKAYLLHTTPTRKAVLNSYGSGKNMKARTDVNWEGVGRAIIYKTVKFHRIQSGLSNLNFSNRNSQQKLVCTKNYLKAPDKDEKCLSTQHPISLLKLTFIYGSSQLHRQTCFTLGRQGPPESQTHQRWGKTAEQKEKKQYVMFSFPLA